MWYGIFMSKHKPHFCIYTSDPIEILWPLGTLHSWHISAAAAAAIVVRGVSRQLVASHGINAAVAAATDGIRI